MSGYKRYPAYKESEVEGVGEIPAGWGIARLKRIAELKYGDSLASEVRQDGDVPVFGSNGIVGNHIEAITQAPCIIVGRKGSFGKVNFSDVECFPIDTTYFIDETASTHNLRWLYYLLQVLDLDSLSKDTGVPGLSREEAYEKIAHLPPPDLEEQIVAFLDRKTAQIDRLIEIKRNQIELLKEERTAIINHAVTKGLNPNAKMKESGIEWIGEIPEEWEVKRLKRIADVKYGLGQPPQQMDNGLPLIRATNVERGKINSRGLIYVDSDDIPYERDPVLKTDDIIVVRSGAYTGDSAIIPDEYSGSIAGYDMVVRVTNAVPKYIAYSLLSDFLLNYQIYLYKQRAAQPHLNAEELGSCIFLLPNEEEQKRIVDHLDERTMQIEQSISQAEKQIKLLQEYRTTLISEAVTGKIDVLEEAA